MQKKHDSAKNESTLHLLFFGWRRQKIMHDTAGFEKLAPSSGSFNIRKNDLILFVFTRLHIS
jgi:hypothetical protein